MKALFWLLPIVALSFCEKANAFQTIDNKVYSTVDFIISGDTEFNSRLRQQIMKLVTRQQVRGQAVGLGPELIGSPNYQIAIGGSCDGAIAAVFPLVERASSMKADKKKILNAYKQTATCKTHPVE